MIATNDDPGDISIDDDFVTQTLLDLVPAEPLMAFLQTLPELRGKNVTVSLRGCGLRNSAADPSDQGIPFGAEVTWQLGLSSPVHVVYDYRINWDPISSTLAILSCCSRHGLYEKHDSKDLEQRLLSLGVLREVSLAIDAEAPSYESLDPRHRAEYNLAAVPLQRRGRVMEVAVDDLSVLGHLEFLVGMPRDLIFSPVILRDRQVLEHYAHKSHGGLVGEDAHLMAHAPRMAPIEAGQNPLKALEAGADGLVYVNPLQWKVGGRPCDEASLRFQVTYGGGLASPIEAHVSERIAKVEDENGRFLGVTQPDAWSNILDSAANYQVWHPASDQWMLGPGAHEWTLLRQEGSRLTKIRQPATPSSPFVEFCFQILRCAHLDLEVSRVRDWSVVFGGPNHRH